MTTNEAVQHQNSELTDALPEFKCPECPKIFTSEQGRRFHIYRAHRPQVKRRYFATREEAIAARREKQKQIRDSYLARGLTADGKPRQRPYRPRKRYPSEMPEARRAAYLKTRQDNYRRGLTAKGEPRKMSEIGRRNVKQAQTLRRARERFHVLGSEVADKEAVNLNSTAINYCPHCGTNIRKYLDR